MTVAAPPSHPLAKKTVLVPADLNGLEFVGFDEELMIRRELDHFFRDQGILFPRRLRAGPDKGELLWALPQHSRILQVLHNPRYAGAFVYGRQRTRRRPDGSTRMVTS